MTLRHIKKPIPKLLHLHIQKRRGRRDFLVFGGFVSLRHEFVQGVDVSGAFVSEEFAIGKVFECGITSDFEAVGEFGFLGGVYFGEKDAGLGVGFLDALVEFLPGGDYRIINMSDYWIHSVCA